MMNNFHTVLNASCYLCRFYQEHGFPGVVGCIDCTHVAIVRPGTQDPEYPEHLYVNRKNYHSINVQLVSFIQQDFTFIFYSIHFLIDM